jgi:hypothetical protein
MKPFVAVFWTFVITTYCSLDMMIGCLTRKGLCNWNMYWSRLKLSLDAESKACP